MKSSLSIDKSFLFRTYAVEYTAEGPLIAHHLPLLVDICLQELLPKSVFDSGTLRDRKGLDAQVIQTLAKSGFRPARGEELLVISGTVAAETDESDDGENTTRTEPFEIRITTEFLEFEGTHHIIHACAEKRTGELPGYIPSKDAARVAPATITFFRLGLELFESRYLTAMLGFAPAATQSLFVESDGTNAFLKIAAESVKKKDELPLSRDKIFGTVARGIDAACGFDLMKDYLGRVRGS